VEVQQPRFTFAFLKLLFACNDPFKKFYAPKIASKMAEQFRLHRGSITAMLEIGAVFEIEKKNVG
jgi:hypothetical protein